MIKEIITTGTDVNSAIDSGCMLLGINREDAQFDIISLPKKGFLGIKSYPAKVRVYIEVPDEKKIDEKKVKAQPAPHKVNTEKQPLKTAKPAKTAENGESAASKPEKTERPVQSVSPSHGHQKKDAPSHDRKERDVQEKTDAVKAQEKESDKEIVPGDEVKNRVQKGIEYLSDIIKAMGYEGVEITAHYYEENVRLQLGGTTIGTIIGRRGETLDALQQLTGLVVNRGEGAYIRLSIDSGNYREKRERTLEALARKLANQAVKTGKSITLEPMNPYERRIIHSAVSSVKGAVSSSQGVEPARRVVISCTDPSKSAGGSKSACREGRSGGSRNSSRSYRGGKNSDGHRKNRADAYEGAGNYKGESREETASAGAVDLQQTQRPEQLIIEKEITEKSKLYGKIEI